MSAEANKAVVRRFFEEVLNGHKLEVAEAIFDPQFVYTEPRSISPGGKGIAALQNEISVYHKAFPDEMWTIHEALATEQDKVVVRWTGQGTHKGDLPGIPATGRKITVEGLTLFTYKNGKIVEMFDLWDALALMQQLSVAPPPEHAR